MIHKHVEYDAEFDVEIPCETSIAADKHGRAMLNRVDLTESIYLGGGTESFGMFVSGKSSSGRWRPETIVLDQGCVLVMFDNGQYIGVPLDKVRFFDFKTNTKRNLGALNAAKARKAKEEKEKEREAKLDS